MNVLASMCDLLFSFRGIKSVNIYVHTCISFIVFFIFSFYPVLTGWSVSGIKCLTMTSCTVYHWRELQ